MEPMQTARRILDDAKPRRLRLPERGIEIGLLEWEGAGPTLLLHHANGFCKGTLGLVADALRNDHHVVAMDARGHGDSSHPEGPLVATWNDFADDVAGVARALAAERGEERLAFGVGHSFGGTVTLGASARQPGLFERLVLIDPVVPVRTGSSGERPEHLVRLIEGARKRRHEWPSREEARSWFAERSLFADWQPEALDLYVLDGLRPCPGGVVLKCSGEAEATVFESGGRTDPMAWARASPAPCRVLWASGGNFPRAVHEALAAEMSAGEVVTVDAGHLVPMERPDLVVAEIRRFP